MAMQLVQVNLGDIASSPLNPRKQFDDARLAQLAESMKSVGVLEPIILRTKGLATNGTPPYELVVGERRWRAAKLAGLPTIPAQVRELKDVEVAEIMLVENHHRDDVHPLEEADGFAQLQVLDRAYSVKAIAAKIGMSERYVQSRLHYTVLTEDVRKAFLANHITAGHAELIARLKPADQARALKRCFEGLYRDDKDNGVIAVRELDRWIKAEIRLDVSPTSAELPLIGGGKPIGKGIDLSTVLQVRNYGSSGSPAGKDLPGPETYRVLHGKKDECPDAVPALVVLGNDRGTLVRICQARTTCKKHWKAEIAWAAQATKAKPVGGLRTKKTDAADRQKAAEHAARFNLRMKAIALAAKRLQALKIATPTPAFLALLRRLDSRWKTWAIGLGALVADDLYVNSEGDWRAAIALLKPLGVRLDVIAADLAPKREKKPAPAKGTPTKKALKRAGAKK